MSVAELMLKSFRGRADHIAVGNGAAFAPEAGVLTAERFEQEHLGGKRCLGFYLLDEESRCYCTCVDFDNKPEKRDHEWHEKAENLYYYLAGINLSPLVELSQSGEAAHVWLFFSEPVEAWIVRAWWRGISAKLDIPMPEVYPRQDELTGKGLGNLVRYPLWSKSAFVDVESMWETIEPESALSSIGKTDAASLKVLAWELGIGELRREVSATVSTPSGALPARVRARLDMHSSLLSRRWHGDMTGLSDASRSSLAQSIACELVRTYVPTHEVEQSLRYWCREFNYEKGERDDWVQRTVLKAYDFVLSRVETKSRDATTLEQSCYDYLDTLNADVRRLFASGVSVLDDSIDGVSRGEMAIVAARPGHGKSTFGLQWLDAAAADGIPCLMISEEMSRLQLGKKSMLSFSGVDEQHWIGSRDLVKHDVKQHFSDRKPIYVQESVATIDRAEEVIDQFCGLFGVGMVAVDYLQLVGSRQQKSYDSVTEVSRRLKQAARRNDCAMLVMCQLNREIEKRKGYLPQNSDLRESGQIEQDADLILFLQWPLRFNSKYHDANEYRIFATKRRDGPIRTPAMVTRFDPDRQLIGERAYRNDVTAYDDGDLVYEDRTK